MVSFSRAIIMPVTLVGAIYLLADLQDKRAIFSTPPSYSFCSIRSQAIRRLMEEMGRIESAGLPTAFTHQLLPLRPTLPCLRCLRPPHQKAAKVRKPHDDGLNFRLIACNMVETGTPT